MEQDFIFSFTNNKRRKIPTWKSNSKSPSHPEANATSPSLYTISDVLKAEIRLAMKCVTCHKHEQIAEL